MSNTKTIVTRIKNKIDTLDKWSSYTGTLLDGEIALVRVPTGDKTNPITGKSEPVWELLMKVGNGTDSFAALPWLNAKSSDVYSWAKKQNLELGDMPLDGLLTELQKTFYTESEVDALLAGKSDNHDHPYLPDTTVYAKGATQNGAAVSANKVNKSVTFATTNGAAAGTAFDGSSAVTVSYATVGAAAASHTHDDRYYTESEIDSKLSGKSDNHDHPYLPDSTKYAGSSTQGGAANSVANSLTVQLNSGTVEGTSKFTFNGSAVKTINITPSSIGASASGHNHDERYYTESEIDSKITVINQAIDGKSASGHTHDDRYYTETEVDDKIAVAVSSALKYKGTKSTTAQLPTSGNAIGDVWNITTACVATSTLPKVNAGDNVAWNGEAWDVLAGTVDLSGYYTESEVDSLLAGKSDNHNHPYLPDSTKYAGSATQGGAANSVANSFKVQLNGGTTEGTDQFTFNGAAAKSVNITPAAIGASASGHNHDDRYYTESEIDSKLAGKANTSHGTHVPTPETADNAKFLRNDNTWQKVTPANIGAAPATHTHTKSQITDFDHSHDDLYYTESEIDSKLDGKASSTHAHGNINNAGTITSTAVTSATGVLVYDSSNKIQRATAANARSIIGAAESGHNHDTRYVRYDVAQTLTDTQKSQARTNIGAAASGHTHSGYESRLTDLEETYISYTQIGTSGTYQMHLGDDTSNVLIFDCGGAE